MRDQTQKAEELLTQLLQCIIDKPDDLKLTFEEMPGRVEWRVWVNIDDQGKVIGRQGLHVKSIQHLLALIGEAAGEQYVLAVFDPKENHRGPAQKRRISEDYDAEEATGLLFDVLDVLLGHDDCDVDVSESVVIEKYFENGFLKEIKLCGFTFKIDGLNEQDSARLSAVTDPLGRGNPMKAIDAIANLYRAFARRDGVAFTVELAQ